MFRIIKCNTLFIIFALLFVVTPISAKKHAKIMLSQTHVDLGGLPYENPVKEFQIVITNKGNDVLNISKILTDCSCTTFSFEKRIIKPNSKDTLNVTVNLNGFFVGDYQKKVAIYSNSKNSPVFIDIDVKLCGSKN